MNFITVRGGIQRETYLHVAVGGVPHLVQRRLVLLVALRQPRGHLSLELTAVEFAEQLRADPIRAGGQPLFRLVLVRRRSRPRVLRANIADLATVLQLQLDLQPAVVAADDSATSLKVWPRLRDDD